MLDLFSWSTGPGARRSDPDTSHAAADRPSLGLRLDRQLVLATHYAHPGGLTDFELASHLSRQQTSVGKRRGELRDLGLIRDSGQKWPAPSGSPAIVWQITSSGIEVMERVVRIESERAVRCSSS